MTDQSNTALRTVFILAFVAMVIFGVLFILSSVGCAAPTIAQSRAAVQRGIGEGLVFCLNHEPARSNPGFRDQCHTNAEFECLEHDLPRQCAEDISLTTVLKALDGGM